MVRVILSKYDFHIGVSYDKETGVLSIMPFPFVVIEISKSEEKPLFAYSFRCMCTLCHCVCAIENMEYKNICDRCMKGEHHQSEFCNAG